MVVMSNELNPNLYTTVTAERQCDSVFEKVKPGTNLFEVKHRREKCQTMTISYS